jgi:hypothetical protein
MLAGTDVTTPFCFPGFSLHDELALLIKAGLPLRHSSDTTRPNDSSQFSQCLARIIAGWYVRPDLRSPLSVLRRPVVELVGRKKLLSDAQERCALLQVCQPAAQAARIRGPQEEDFVIPLRQPCF